MTALLAIYHLAWGAVLGVTQMSGWEGGREPLLLDGLLAASLLMGLVIGLGQRRGRFLRPWLQHVVVAGAIVGVAAASFAAGGNEGVALAFGIAYLALIAGAFFPFQLVVAHLVLIGAAYGAVVLAGGGSFPQWVLVTGLTGSAGGLAGRINRRLIRLTARLERVEQWRATLMSALAHDLRSPLATVDSTIALLQRRRGELSAAQIGALLDAASRQTGRSLQMANDLLDHERIRGGTLQLDREKVPLRPAVVQATTYLADVHVEVDVPEDIVVNVDVARFEQMLINLLANAVRHGLPPIEVRAVAESDGAVRLSVRDHGAGVPEAVRDRLFERFSASGAAGSVGLGLWIVDQLAQAHGAAVTYEDADPGARFTIHLPDGQP